MKKLVFDPQPRKDYPFKDFAMNPVMQGTVRFPYSGKNMREFVKGGFVQRKGLAVSEYFKERQQVRARLRDMLAGRGYEVEERFLDDDLLSVGAGGVGLTNTGFDAAEGDPYQAGVLINTEFGNIEAPHVYLLVEMLRRAVQEDVGWVLDVGCGPFVEQKLNLESLGLKRIIYADINPQFLSEIEEGLVRQGRPDIQRKFVQTDKADLLEVVPSNSVRTIIRAGVGRMDAQEARALRTVGTKNVEIYVSNGIDGPSSGQFFAVAEDHFGEIEVHIGYERYVALCKAA